MTRLPDKIDNNARIGVRKADGATTYLRRRINLIEGSNVTLTVGEDVTDEEVDITITATGTTPPSGSAGGVLEGTYPNPGLAASVAGNGLAESADVLSVNVDGTTIEINADTLRVKAGGIGANEIASTAVTPAAYGDSTHYATFTVDSDGRLTAAASVATSTSFPLDDTAASVNDYVLREKVTGDADWRFKIRADGAHIWPDITSGVTQGFMTFTGGHFELYALNSADMLISSDNAISVTALGDISLTRTGGNITLTALKNVLDGRTNIHVSNSAPTDGTLSAGQYQAWVDETNNLLKFRVKYSDGSLKTGNVPLPGWALFDHYTDVGNSTTTETDLYSDTTAASQLAGNGDKIQAHYGGIFVSSGTATRQVKVYFGGTAIFDSGALTVSLSAAWDVEVLLIRVSSTVIRYSIAMNTEGAALAAYTAVGELTGLTLSNTNVLKITGQAGGVGAATNDIVAKLGFVEFHPAV